ncbi:polyprenyl synthetase family protein [Thermogemmatispora sp.]|uniref:polyprenyl synthetase family protein n=1 Tax=Thermogemmatispora sp. TaxID=1968838 RepID=UPI001DAA5A54|nr:polyprenyl synthetase family protein [Thermogemmatispora sp.]MBX5450527.1 polyprenyl synthetase family protein [Thermogemmatispora sp.]
MNEDRRTTVREEVLREALMFLSDWLERFLLEAPAPLREDLALALHQEGKLLTWRAAGLDGGLLGQGPGGLRVGRWPLLTFLIALALRPEEKPDYAAGAALAVECLVCAIDIFDDLIDDDQTPLLQTIGEARAINVAAALLTLAQRAILAPSASVRPPAAEPPVLLAELQAATLACLAGQQQDLLAEALPFAACSREECLALAAAKAGSLMRLACRLGALAAGASPSLCDQFSRLGELLGIAGQLDNDCHDLHAMLTCPPTLSRPKSDLRRGKKTLPLVLAAASGCSPDALLALQQGSPIPTALSARLAEAITAAWSISLLYRERARLCLQAIEACQPLPPELLHILGL